ncbi:50S ribosomal protein L10 [Methanobrevibacter sp. 87.7]|uniref:50S ribosomal protein L10 n=1 Tax=Methanobrevibacter sp. 87.7 TaxID=387957 RepID=UPI000B4FFA7E|nr:50S ribosomal protein L10 [Methanobrevibacter sp. 87.7]OWT33836.1 50S ribosomal protein L10 [Methanobrevibacter sp. 87.7]
MSHVAEWKKEEVKEIVDLINSYEVVGVVDLLNIPARQLQEMRKSLSDHAVIRLSKKNLINLAFEDCNKSKENIVNLSEYLTGQPALIFTDMNPFRLYKILEDNKTDAPAKAGSVAGEDIVVPKGDTGFEPGPFLGELQQIGAPAKIDKGKIVVDKDSVVVEAGDVVSQQIAGVLTRLGIKPMEVGIDLHAVYEEGSVYKADVLAIDEEETIAKVQDAYIKSFNLSVFAGIPTKETISTMIGTAHSKSVNLAVEAGIVNSDTSDIIFGLANGKMLALASKLSDDALDEDLEEKLANVASAAPAAPKEDNDTEDEEEEEETEEEAEEEAAAGLGALFG